MKKLCIVLCVLLLTSCAPKPVEQTGFTVVATFYPVYLAALNVMEGAVGANVTLLTQPTTGCLHEYQLTPAELERLQSAQLLLTAGAGMESFLSRVTESYPNLPLVDGSKGIALLPGQETPENPHYWVYPPAYAQMVDTIAAALAEADKPNADVYTRNATAYKETLAALDTELKSALQNATDRKVVTFHEAFDYWVAPYGFAIAATIEREPGTEPTPADLADTIAVIQAQKVTALFAEPQYSDNAAQTIGRETGLTVFLLDPIASGETDKTYYETHMRQNCETLQTALGGN